ncbi:MAG: PVC-type heme-binding CxxCH protein [Pirellulales bacterium]
MINCQGYLVRGLLLCLLMLSNQKDVSWADDDSTKIFQAGVFAVDITPIEFPVIVNGYFTERTAERVTTRLMSRAVVLDDGKTRIAIVVVDNLMIPRSILDEAKQMASKGTGIPVDRILISATHTHSAPSAMACLGSRSDTNYARFLPGQISKSIVLANERLATAKIGWTVVEDREHGHCRRWIYRADHLQVDPFGDSTVRAHMHPGHQNPKHIGPSGPADQDLSLLAIQGSDGRLLSILGNYAMHFFGSTPLSADACGIFGTKFRALLEEAEVHPDYVGILSQGTSGDAAWMDYSKPAADRTKNLDNYTEAMAKVALSGFRIIKYHNWVPLAMAEQTLEFDRRAPNAKRLTWARDRAEKLGDQPRKVLPDIYAFEAIDLHHEPRVEIKLQAIRIGDLGITALPHEVYALTGLKLKAKSPFATTFNIELANGAQGYIPPPEQHQLGGYTTWPAKTAGLEVQAEPQIVETLLTLLEKVAGKPRREIVALENLYMKAIAKSEPLAYWQFEEMADFAAVDRLKKHHGIFEAGVARYLPGPEGTGITAGPRGNRAAHFAGGRMRASCQELGENYSVECWFWNGLPHDVRPVTGYFFSRGKEGDSSAAGDHLGIGGSHRGGKAAGKLIFFNGNKANQLLVGKTDLQLRSWNHVVLVREGSQITVYLNGHGLNGHETPEISGEAKFTCPAEAEIYVGGRSDQFALFEGKVDEVSLYNRPLTAEEIAHHFQQSAVQPPDAVAKKKSATADLPRPESQPLSPIESLATIHVPEGFEIELVAAEPLIRDPVALAWDEQGRLWVAEMSDYPLGIDGQGKSGGRIRILEDTNGDGAYNHSQIFIEDLAFPSGVLPWKQGVLITTAPNILYAADTDDDGKADKTEILFAGFQERNQQLRVNGLRWGLDNWIYCASGSHVARYDDNSRIRSTQTGEMILIGSRDFRFRPTTGQLDPQAGPSQFGRNCDDWGNWFGSMNSHPLWHYVLEDHYTRRNPYVAPPEPRRQLILPRNPKVYPAKEPQKRFHSFRQSGRFTSACSAMIYRDQRLFTDSNKQHGFTCEPFHNLVQHFAVQNEGVSFIAERSPAEAKFDFFASTDRWCRPVMATTGPDGALWIADMYRYMIEHPQWLTLAGREELKPFFRHGDTLGRIYRIYPKGKKPGKILRLKSLSGEALVQALETPSGVQRDLVQQSLIVRADPATQPLLEDLIKSSSQPLARLHALCTLDGLGAITPEIVLIALADKHPGVQRQAIRIAEPFAGEHPDILNAVSELSSSSHAKVRLQLACSLGEWSGEASARCLARLMMQDQSDIYLAAAAMSSISAENIEIVLQTVLSNLQNSNTGRLLNRLIEQAIAFESHDAARDALQFMLNSSNAQKVDAKFDFLSSLFKFMKRHQISPATFFESHESLYEQSNQLVSLAREIVADSEAEQSLRIAAIPVLARLSEQQHAELQLLAANLTPQTAPAVQLATIDFLSTFQNAEVAELLLENWPSHVPTIRTPILSSLLSRPRWINTLLDQIENKTIAAAALDVTTRQKLAAIKDEKIQTRVATILKSVGNSDRQTVVDHYRDALTLEGNRDKGKRLFQKKCAVCHRLEKVGHDIGPNIASLTDRRPETLLTAILNPSAAVDSKYLTYTVVTDEGRSYSGILGAETGSSLTLVMQENKHEVILRNQIDEIQSTGKSMMPDGLEEQTSTQDFADLLAYLQSKELN